MYLWLSYKKKNMKNNNFFYILTSLKKEVGSGAGFGLARGSGDLDPHQNVTDPQHC
jgi:hypothetical protein